MNNISKQVVGIFQDVYNNALDISMATNEDTKSSNSNVIQLIRVNTIKLRKVYVTILEEDDYHDKINEYFTSMIMSITVFITNFKMNLADFNNSLDVDNIFVRFFTNYFLNWYKFDQKQNEATEQSDFDIFFSQFFLEKVFVPLISNVDPNIRYITLKIMILLFENFDALYDHDYSLILEKINERIYDKDEKVRSQAIIALSKFQNDQNNLKKFVSLLRNDSSSLIRKLIIANISGNESSKAHSYILERYMDKSADVRKEMYTSFLGKKFSGLDVFKKIKNTLLIKILYNGFLLDRDFSVNEAVFKLLFAWLNGCDFNLEKFISLFKIETFLADQIALNKIESILQNFIHVYLLRSSKRNSKYQQIELEDILGLLSSQKKEISLNQSFILKLLFKVLCSNEFQFLNTSVDDHIPTAIELIDVMKKYDVNVSTVDETIYMNLLDISKSTQDFKDELSRRAMLQYLRQGLLNFKHDNYVELSDERIDEELHDEIEELVTMCPLLKKYQDPKNLNNSATQSHTKYYTTRQRILNISIELIFSKLSLNNLDFLDIVMNLIWDMRDQEEEELEKEIQKNKKFEANKEKDIGKKRYREENTPSEEDLDLPKMDDSSDEESDDEDKKSIFVKSRPSLSCETLSKILTISEAMLLQLPNPTLSSLSSSGNSVADIENNLYFESLIDTLITPAIRQNESQELRNLGIANLSLVCLLDINLMRENLHIFGMCASKHLPSDSDENFTKMKLLNALEFRDISLKTILDALLTFDIQKLLPEEENKTSAMKLFSLFKIFYKILKENESRKTDNLIITGVFKLYLYQKIDHLDLLQMLVLIYYYPINSNNFKLLQTYASFLPTLCFSSYKNQNLLVELVPDLLFRLLALYEENEKSNKRLMKAKEKKHEEANEDEDDFLPKMKTPSQIAKELMYWTNPNNLRIRTTNDEENKDKMLGHMRVIEILLFHYSKINEVDFMKLYKLIAKRSNNIDISSKSPLKDLLKLKMRIEYLDENFEIPLLNKQGSKKVANQFYDDLCAFIDQRCLEENISEDDLIKIQEEIDVEDEVEDEDDIED
ncbi:hypothetical protein ACO0R3_000761 [Hanseniaspora guilliermondii]